MALPSSTPHVSHPQNTKNATAAAATSTAKPPRSTRVSSLFSSADEASVTTAAATAAAASARARARRTADPAVFSGTRFRDLGLTDRLVRQLEEHMGLRALTPAQQLAAPFLLCGRDVLLKSPTGTGKTLAYAVPIVHDLQGLQHRV